MNDRPTPETDEAERLGSDKGCWVRADFARKLERERDEARGAIVGWENKWKCAVEMAARAEVERDIARLSALESDRAHDRIVGELEGVYKERDEVRKIASDLADQAVRLREERDEVREKLAHITTAAQAVVDRWEQPVWKDTEPTATVIYRLRDALGREAE